MSWIKTKFFEEGNGASGVKIARAEALWHMGKQQEAIETCREALKLSPKAFRINLRLARWLNATNAPADARKEVEEAMEIKKDSFLPRGYMVALEDERTGSAEAQKRYETYLKELDEELFGEEPVWPPGGERFLHDIWYREDLTFVFDRLLKLVRRS
jgi:tetratricopeptide (TPR) repeat protein